jgi:hypothetical protein
LLPLFATGVNDTGGKFAAGVVDTGGNLPPGGEGEGTDFMKGKLSERVFFCIFVPLLVHVPDLSPI